MKTKLALKDRTYVCEACGMVMDRDLNAAINILAAGRAAEAENGREEDVRPASLADLCEASTRQSLKLSLATDAGTPKQTGSQRNTSNGSPDANGEPRLTSAQTRPSDCISLTGAKVAAGSLVELTGTFSEDSGYPVLNVTSCTVLQNTGGAISGPENVTRPEAIPHLSKDSNNDALTVGILKAAASGYTYTFSVDSCELIQRLRADTQNQKQNF